MRAWLTAFAAMTWLASCLESAAMANEPTPVDFASKIRPIFERSCLKCHGPEKQRGGLRLDVRASVVAGGDSGEAAIVPGKVESSALLERVSSDEDDRRMPPEGKRLSADEVSLLRRWVAEGASWPMEAEGAAAKAGDSEMVVTGADRDHWSFRPIRRITPFRDPMSGAVSNPIDDFLNAARRAKKLTPGHLGRSADLDPPPDLRLAGLPPTPEEVAAFVADETPDAYERLVDRLLASPGTASDGADTGSTSPDTPTATATRATSTGRRPTAIATSSSVPSTPTCRSTSSSAGRSPATSTSPTTPRPRRDRLLHRGPEPGDDAGRHRGEQGQDPLRRAGQHRCRPPDRACSV